MRIHSTLDGGDVQTLLAEMIWRVLGHAKISVYLESHVSKVDGHVGHFTSKAVTPQGEIELKHGVVVVATGATELKPKTYGYGSNPKVVTQLELTDRLGREQIQLPDRPTVVMIQCVETARPGACPIAAACAARRPSRNALAIKKMHPQAKVVVLYRDMRTYRLSRGRLSPGPGNKVCCSCVTSPSGLRSLTPTARCGSGSPR